MTPTPSLDKPPNFDMFEDSALHRAAKERMIKAKVRSQERHGRRPDDLVTCPHCGSEFDPDWMEKQMHGVEGHASSVEGASRATAGR